MGFFVGRQRQQRRASGRRPAFPTALAQQALRAFLRVQFVARGRVDRLAVARAVQIETQAQRGQQLAFEATQGPGQAGAHGQPRTCLAVGQVQPGQRVGAGRRRVSSLR